MKKKILFLLLSSCVLLSLFPLNVSGYIGSKGSEVQITDPNDGGGGNLECPNKNRIFDGKDGYFYALAGWGHVDNGFPTYWFFKYSDDNGTTWNTASPMSTYLLQADLQYPVTKAEVFDAVYDDDDHVFHVAWYYTAQQGGSYNSVRYARCTALGNGTISVGTVQYLGNYTKASESGGISVALIDDVPVVVATHYDNGESTWQLKFFWAESDNPGDSEDWDSWDENFSYCHTEMHTVSSEKILLLYQTVGSDGYVYGRYFTASGWDGSAMQITEREVEQTSYVTSNNGYPSGFDSVSEYSLDFDDFADEIFIVYMEKDTADTFGTIWDVSSEERDEDQGIQTGGSNCYYPNAAKDGVAYFAHIHYRNETSHSTLKIYERSHAGVWDSGTDYAYRYESWSPANLDAYSMSKTPLNGSLFFLWRNTAPRYIYPVPAYADYFMEITVDAEDIDDDEDSDWIFTNWRYYTFTMRTNFPDILNASIGFIVPLGSKNVYCGFYSDGDDWIYGSDLAAEDRYGEPCLLQEGTWSFSDTVYTITWPIWFDSQILDIWLPNDAVDVYYQLNASDWIKGANNLFRIYTKGGFTLNYDVSDPTYAWKLPGGSPFCFHVEDGDEEGWQWAYNEVWYRDVQHIKLLPEVHFLAELDDFRLVYGVDYSLGDGEWLRGWVVSIKPDFVSYTGIFAGNVWINMTTTMSDRHTLISDYNYENLYMFYHGSVSGSGDPGHWDLWLDIWFSEKNASSILAGRVNAYEFSMTDNADVWLRWLANNWGVKDDVYKEIQAEAALIDADNNTISSESIKMVRYWCNVTVFSGGYGQIIEIPNYDAFDVTRSNQLPLTGISTPVFDETLIPVVNQRGILGALWSMFAGLGAWLSENVLFGGLNLWGTFVNFLDTIAGFFGAPKFFTNLFNWLAELFSYIVSSAGYLITIIGDIFDLFGSLMGIFLNTMGEIISSLLSTFTMMVAFFGGAYGVGVDLWNFLDLGMWLTLVITFYPLYLIILWDDKGMDAVIQQLTWLFGLLTWVFGFLISVIQFTLHLVERIVESIPVVE